MFHTHKKYVGFVQAIDTYGDVWTQDVRSGDLGFEGWIGWRMSAVPLPPGTAEGHYISVHRTKAGAYYAVNLSHRMPPYTEHQVKAAKAWARRMIRLFADDDQVLDATTPAR